MLGFLLFANSKLFNVKVHHIMMKLLEKTNRECSFLLGEVEDELLHTYRKVYTFDTLLLMVRLAVLVAVTLTVPIVLFPVSHFKQTLSSPSMIVLFPTPL